MAFNLAKLSLGCDRDRREFVGFNREKGLTEGCYCDSVSLEFDLKSNNLHHRPKIIEKKKKTHWE